MRIAFFTDSYDSHLNYIDGVAIISQKFVNYANQRGIFLTVYTNGDEDGTEEISETIRINRFKPKIPWYLPSYKELLLDLQIPNPKLMADFEKNTFDVIHFTQPATMGINAIYASGRPVPKFPFTAPAFVASIDIPFFRKKRERILPLVGSFHTNVPAFAQARTGSKFARHRIEEMVNHVYKNCDIILATSLFTQNEISQYIEGKAFGLFRSGVDLDAFNPKKRDNEFRKGLDDKIILFFAGRLSPEKNIQLLVNAYIELCKRNNNIHLFVAGDGILRDPLKKELGEKITAPGFLHGEDLYRAFASSDIFVFPSLTDTLGLVVLEAQASGLPVVVMDQGGPKEVMEDGKTGFLCRADVTEDFIKNVESLIASPETRESMRKSARILAEQYSWERAFDDLIKVYERVMDHV